MSNPTIELNHQSLLGLERTCSGRGSDHNVDTEGPAFRGSEKGDLVPV
jgi:hypothetical protein